MAWLPSHVLDHNGIGLLALLVGDNTWCFHQITQPIEFILNIKEVVSPI
jgi:hypothetical protein